MTFEAIKTQEEFDAAIGARLKRERETIEGRFADYEALKTELADYQKQVKHLTDQLATKDSDYSAQQSAFEALSSKVKEYEFASLKERVARESGLPYDLSQRIRGADEQALREDAMALSEIVKAQGSFTPPLKDNEAEVGGEDQAYKTLLSNL